MSASLFLSNLVWSSSILAWTPHHCKLTEHWWTVMGVADVLFSWQDYLIIWAQKQKSSVMFALWYWVCGWGQANLIGCKAEYLFICGWGPCQTFLSWREGGGIFVDLKVHSIHPPSIVRALIQSGLTPSLQCIPGCNGQKAGWLVHHTPTL